MLKQLYHHFLLSLLLLTICTSCKPKEVENQASLKIATLEGASTVDPRKGSDLATMTTLKLLYEGLTSLDSQGQVHNALAQHVQVSEDQKVYTIQLRKSYWSNGSVLTAADFTETWLDILSPNFPSANAYQFYGIKGAKDYKTGKASREEVGIHLLDEQTLQVELVQPMPYFLSLLSAPFFLPTPAELRHSTGNEDPTTLPYNGPFELTGWKHKNEMKLAKNKHYWNKSQVPYDQISLIALDENIAYQMFQAGELDWIGSPYSTVPQDAIATLKQRGALRVLPAAGTYWFRFNVNQFPFNQAHMRRAFTFALNRQAIIEHVARGGQKPALGVVPPIFSAIGQKEFEDQNMPQAWEEFQLALNALDKDKDEVPAVTLCYSSAEREHKIAQAVQQQWQKAFGIKVNLERCESKMYSAKVNKGDYQIALGSWFADFMDPINFLEIFNSKTNPSNKTGWENTEYTRLIAESASESLPEQRMEILQQAENILMQEMPVAPLYFASFNYLKTPKAKQLTLTPLGYFTFSEAAAYNDVQ